MKRMKYKVTWKDSYRPERQQFGHFNTKVGRFGANRFVKHLKEVGYKNIKLRKIFK